MRKRVEISTEAGSRGLGVQIFQNGGSWFIEICYAMKFQQVLHSTSSYFITVVGCPIVRARNNDPLTSDSKVHFWICRIVRDFIYRNLL